MRSSDGGSTWRLSNAGLNQYNLVSASDLEDGWLYSSFWASNSDYNSFLFVFKSIHIIQNCIK